MKDFDSCIARLEAIVGNEESHKILIAQLKDIKVQIEELGKTISRQSAEIDELMAKICK